MKPEQRDTKSGFSEAQEADIAEYRSVSLLSLAALGLGLLSPLALAFPLFLVVPVLAVLAALAAMRVIAANPSSLIGRKAAIVGLMLGLLFGAAAPARVFSRDWVMQHRARAFAQSWFELLREGRFYEAHQLTLDRSYRERVGIALDLFYESNADMREKYDIFIETPPADKLFEFAGQGELRFDGIRSAGRRKSNDFVDIQYTFLFSDDGRNQEIPVIVLVSRKLDRDGKTAHWRIFGIRPLDKE